MGNLWRKGRSCLLALCVLVLTVVTASCGAPRVERDFRGEGFSATVAWKVGELDAVADVTVSAPDMGNKRAVTMTLKEPAVLADTVVERSKEGVVTVSVHGMEIRTDAAEALLAPAWLMLGGGELQGVCQTELLGQTVLYAEAGSGEESRCYEFYLDPESFAPLRVAYGEQTVEVRAFDATSDG